MTPGIPLLQAHGLYFDNYGSALIHLRALRNGGMRQLAVGKTTWTYWAQKD